MNIDKLSHKEKTVFLARMAHLLTVVARSTYTPGTEDVAEPRKLRAYNELLHRVTSSVRSHVEDVDGMPLEAVLKMMRDYGVSLDMTDKIEWVINQAKENIIGDH